MKQIVADYLKDKNTFATVLLSILVDHFGSDALGWDTDTIDREIQDTFNVIMPSINRDKMQAVIGLLTTDAFYNDWLAFNHVCEAFNNDPVDFDILDPISPEMMAWSITEATFLEDPEDKPEFDEEVRAFMGAILYDNGIRNPRGVLKLAIMPDTSTDWETDTTLFNGLQAQDNSDAKSIQDYVVAHGLLLIGQLDKLPMLNKDDGVWSKFRRSAEKVLMDQAR